MILSPSTSHFISWKIVFITGSVHIWPEITKQIELIEFNGKIPIFVHLTH